MEKKTRLVSLDILRGITIIGMLIVNNPGSWGHVYTPLLHTKWNGLTPTDFVFPFFMFIMGISIYIALQKFHFTYSKVFIIKVIRRTLLLFMIGLFLNWFSQGFCSLNELRITGVLQRLSLCYFFTCLLCITIRDKYIPFLVTFLLLVYAVILYFGNGFIYGPQNILSKVDQYLFGLPHLYNDNGLDPEGLLSTLPSIAHTLIGYQVGKICIEKGDIQHKLLRLFLIGTVLLFAGYLLSYGCPINKKIWSPTFVFATCGAGTLLLSLLVWIVDIKKYQNGCKIFIAYGVNPLFCYIAGNLLSVSLIYISIKGKSLHSWFYQDMIISLFGNTNFSSLASALSLAFIIGIIGNILHRKGIYIKI